jgi:hypothetical protein
MFHDWDQLGEWETGIVWDVSDGEFLHQGDNWGLHKHRGIQVDRDTDYSRYGSLYFSDCQIMVDEAGNNVQLYLEAIYTLVNILRQRSEDF